MKREKVLGFFGWLVLFLWGGTVRLDRVNGEIPDRLRRDGRNFIYAFWHGRQFLLYQEEREPGVVIPASESRDGDIQAEILRRFHYDVVRGSSKRKGERALLGLVSALRNGRSIALAVDGPRGPVYEVKQGVTYLAGKLDRSIIPVATGAKRHWVLGKIWDKYLLPVPFTRGVVVYGEPITVSGTSEQELESKRVELQQALNKLMAAADAYFAQRA